jgi:hypothetical protein
MGTEQHLLTLCAVPTNAIERNAVQYSSTQCSALKVKLQARTKPDGGLGLGHGLHLVRDLLQPGLRRLDLAAHLDVAEGGFRGRAYGSGARERWWC